MEHPLPLGNFQRIFNIIMRDSLNSEWSIKLRYFISKIGISLFDFREILYPNQSKKY